MVSLLLLLVGWVIWNNKPLPFFVPEPLWNSDKQKLSNFRIDFFYHSVISPFAIKFFLLPFSSHCSTQNISFSDSFYIIKPPQPSSAVHGALPFAGYPCFNWCLVPVSSWFHFWWQFELWQRAYHHIWQFCDRFFTFICKKSQRQNIDLLVSTLFIVNWYYECGVLSSTYLVLNVVWLIKVVCYEEGPFWKGTKCNYFLSCTDALHTSF